jgi:CheY-like chemotaxis protein
MNGVDFSRLSFLVVDDNTHMRQILRALLHSFGARNVREAVDGATGLDAFVHYDPDIVLLDWNMPIFDGIELTQMIRQPDSMNNPYVPIILITGHTEQHRIIAARNAGVNEILAKPVSSKALYQRIVSVVVNPRPFLRTKDYFGPDRRRDAKMAYHGPERRGVATPAAPASTPALASR